MPTSTAVSNVVSIDDFAAEARAWLEANGTKREATSRSASFVWGEGDFSTAVFHALTFEEEKAVLDELRAWHQKKAEVGYHAITEDERYGGLGLSNDHSKAFHAIQSEFEQPEGHETFSVTTRLIAPTVRLLGTEEQRDRFAGLFFRSEALCAQLFSEPGAGSDLANLACRADRDGDEWVLNGQKVWSSGAQFAEWSLCICRSDVDAPKHKGMTAFLIPMDHPGVEVRQIKQMSGGTSFNEVFLTDCRLGDDLRLGDVGEGWKVALTVLGFERGGTGDGSGAEKSGGTWTQTLGLARHLGKTDDPVARQMLSALYIDLQIQKMTRTRVDAMMKQGQPPGPEGSIGKLLWVEGLNKMSNTVSHLLGPALTADNGEWGQYGWAEHVLGSPGYHIAGGSDEIQRNIIGERVLGLPGEPRVDKGLPFKDIPK